MQGTGRPFSEESDLKNLKIMTFGVSPTRRDRSHCPRIVVLICDDLAPREQLMMSRHSFDCHDQRGVAGISLRRGQGYWWASYNVRVSPATHQYSAIPISLVFSLTLNHSQTAEDYQTVQQNFQQKTDQAQTNKSSLEETGILKQKQTNKKTCQEQVVESYSIPIWLFSLHITAFTSENSLNL